MIDDVGSPIMLSSRVMGDDPPGFALYAMAAADRPDRFDDRAPLMRLALRSRLKNDTNEAPMGDGLVPEDRLEARTRDLEIEMAELRIGVLHASEEFRQFRINATAASVAATEEFRRLRSEAAAAQSQSAATIKTLATKDDVAAIQSSIAKKDDWWKNGIIGPLAVGMALAGLELWLKHSP